MVVSDFVDFSWWLRMETLIPSDLVPSLYEIYRLTGRLAMVSVIFVPLERLFAAHPQKVFRKESGIDLAYYVMNSLIVAGFLSIPIGMMAWALQKALPSEVLALTSGLPTWGRLCLAFVVGEIGYYWGHRLTHTIPWLWDYHSIHHSAEKMDFLVNTRAHPVDLIFSRLCSLGPQYAIGLGGLGSSGGSWIPVFVALFGLFWGYFVHANVRWRFGWLERLIATPGFHHWHHTKSGPINKNYASSFPWIDWIFGTLHLPPKELPAEYGVNTPIPASFVGQLVLPVSPGAPSLWRLRRSQEMVMTAIPEAPAPTTGQLASTDVIETSH